MDSISTAVNGLSGHRLSPNRPTMHWLQQTCVGLCLAVFALAAPAQTITGGAVGSDTVWRAAQSPYVVTGDILVQNGATLTIEAGTTVYMGADTRFTVQSGALKAIGTAQAPIKLTSQKLQNNQTPAPGDWQQLTFSTGITNTTQLEYVQIEYGRGIVVIGASPTFNYLTINNNQGAAITVDLAASPSGVGNQASGNAQNAIVVPAGDINGSVTWGVRGIPYLVPSGTVSVGSSPVISAINLTEIQQGESISAVLSGSRLTGVLGTGVSATGVSASAQGGATDTDVPIKLTASSDAELGMRDVSLEVDAGRVSLEGALRVIRPRPVVTGLSPGSLYTMQTEVVLTVSGKSFVPESIIQLDGVDLATTFASASSLSTSLPLLTSGNKSVTVKQPDPQSAGTFLVSPPAQLIVNMPALSLTPASVVQAPEQPLTLTVTIPFPAPTGGIEISLSSSATATASVPASVVIVEGATGATVPITVAGVGNASITASRAGFSDAVSVLTLSGTRVRRYALIPTLTSTTSASALGIASASSSYESPSTAHGIYSAFDNDPSGRWVTNTTALGQWLKWSFVSGRAVTAFEYTTGNLLSIQLQYSDDDINWFSASQVSQEGAGNFIRPTTTGTTPHRHWRLYVDQVYGATVGNWYGFDKFQLFGDTPLATTASGWYSTSVPAFGTDSTLSTGWNAGRFAPAWIAMDLGIVRPISEVRVFSGTGYPSGITNYDIQVSNDSVSWTTVAQASNGDYWTNTPLSVAGRYVRLTITSHTGGSWIALHEFQVY